MKEGIVTRDYQRMKNNKYILPTAVYHRTIWTIRDYYRLAAEADELITASPQPPDGMPKGDDVGSPVENKVMARERLMLEVTAIDGALKTIPPEYRHAVWASIQFGARYPNHAERATYGHYKSKFICEVARRLKYIDDL